MRKREPSVVAAKPFGLLVLAMLGLGAGCTSSASDRPRIDKPPEASIRICHGHGCARRTRVDLDGATMQKLAALMAPGKGSADAERRAISAAVQYFERQSTAIIGVRDAPKSAFAATAVPKGQMDCIDESTNTRALLLQLQARGLLRHHVVERNVSRGFFADGRYPHFTAVIRDTAGAKWSVDSWFEAAGGAPDIWPLPVWQARGVAGERY